MATGAISSLGIGSGVLTGDVIDQLKEADKKTMVEPYDRKLKANQEKQAALAVLKSSLDTMGTISTKLSDFSTYLGRSSSVSGDEVSASVGAGFVPQDIKVSVQNLAAQDVVQAAKGFASRDSSFSTYNNKLSFNYGGENYSINIQANTPLSEVAQSITDATGGKVAATIMKTGGTNPYQLTLTGTDSGKENKIYLGSTLNGTTTSTGSLELGAGDFTFNFKDSTGTQRSVDVTLPATDSENSKYDNAEAVKQALWDAIDAAGYGDLLYNESDSEATKNNPLTIDYDSESGGLIINDSRGLDISVSGNKLSDLGLNNNTSASKESVLSVDSVKAGLIDGKFYLGADLVDLSTITSSGNSAEQNAQAIVDYINDNIGGTLTATKGSGDSFTVDRVDGGDYLNIALVGADGSQDRKDSRTALSALGLSGGTYNKQSNLLTGTLNLQSLQRAQDAEFTYNGVQINRSTNTVDDLVSGLTLTLNTVHDSGDFSTVRISEDKSGIADDVKAFVEEYNNFMKQLATDTDYNEDLGTAGVFQGVSEIYSIRSNLNSILTFSDANQNSLMSFGLYLNEDGTLELDEEKLSSKIEADFQGTQDFFRGYTTTVNGREKEFDGVFTQFRDKIADISSDPDSRLARYDDYLTDEMDGYYERRNDALAFINSRYEIMTMRFAAYDNIINGLNSSFSSLQQMIEQANK